MIGMSRRSLLLLLAALVLPAAVARAEGEAIRVGVLSQDTGPFAQNGRSFRQGIAAYQAIHGETVGNRKIEFVYRDIGGEKPGVAKQLAEQLIVRDKVKMFAGFVLTSEALAITSVADQTKTPAVSFIASSPMILTNSKFFLKAGQHISQSSSIGAVFARKQGKSRAYIVVSDYQPGHDAQKTFRKTFESLGGTVVGEVRVPLSTIDFSSVVERIAQTKPDAINVFVPPGAPAIALLRALSERGLTRDTLVVGMGEAEDHVLLQYDDSVLGYYGALYYAEALDNSENKAFIAKLKELNGPDTLPDFAAASAYDGTALIYHMVEALKGKEWDGAAALQAALGYSWNGVRGPITVDPNTRELIQNIYVRQVRKIDGKLKNVIVDQFPNVKAPTAEWMAN